MVMPAAAVIATGMVSIMTFTNVLPYSLGTWWRAACQGRHVSPFPGRRSRCHGRAAFSFLVAGVPVAGGHAPSLLLFSLVGALAARLH
jgi:hypothetical protein